MEQVGFDGSEVLVGKLKELVRLPSLPGRCIGPRLS